MTRTHQVSWKNNIFYCSNLLFIGSLNFPGSDSWDLSLPRSLASGVSAPRLEQDWLRVPCVGLNPAYLGTVYLFFWKESG